MTTLRIKPTELAIAECIQSALLELGANESLPTIIHAALHDGLMAREKKLTARKSK